MTLEEESSETVLLTRKQREGLKRDILYRYHNLGERAFTPEEIEEVYSHPTGIPKEIVYEELAKIKPKNKAPKEKRQYSGKLETVLREDLGKFGQRALKVGRGILKTITYPTLGVNFALPTMIRKSKESEGIYGIGDIFSIALALGYAGVDYLAIFRDLSSSCGCNPSFHGLPELALPLALTQIGTNIASGIYEYVRHVKKKAKEYTPRGGRFN